MLELCHMISSDRGRPSKEMQQKIVALLVFCGVLTSLCLAAVPGDEVKGLPGWQGALPTTQYSGYIEIDALSKSYLHYWFVESENDPKEDPVVIWMNGGPGCSSMEGYFMELGPLHFDPSTINQTVPTLVRNPNAWNTIANVLFLEAPLGVGFSYSLTKAEYITNDTKTASDNYVFVQKWLEAFPEYKSNPLYITGESYAGIYVPTLAENIMNGNDKNISDINLAGFMVGNGCIGTDVGGCSQEYYQIIAMFLWGHGMYSPDLHIEITKHCDFPNLSNQCLDLISRAIRMAGPLNVYDVYDDCSGDFAMPSTFKANNMHSRLLKSVGLGQCANDGKTMAHYLNLPEVRVAIHVRPESDIGKWVACTDKIDYTSNIKSLLTIYPTLIKRYRVLIYNGDVDACVPYLGDEWWTSGLGLTVEQPWRAWYVNQQVAGYVTEYELNGFKFVTVKGSGHMVPQYQPESAFAMFERYLHKKPF